ncbi:hypothetical protein ABPG72_010565 [Tetrahymena utriculariae]
MIARSLIKRSLYYIPRAGFSGGDIRHKFSNEITDEDYDYQRALHVKPPKEENLFQLTNILSSVPIFKTRSFLNLIARNLDTNSAASTSDFVAPPRVHENSFFVYHSRELGNVIRKYRSLESVILPGALLTFTYPLFAAFVAIPSYYFMLNAKIYEMSRRFVVRMDVLPHLEMISVQRIGAFGILYTKLHRIQDLEYIPFDQVKEQENYLWAIGGHGVDNQLIFKDRSTGEFFYFERQGVWDAKGLNHPLLN